MRWPEGQPSSTVMIDVTASEDNTIRYTGGARDVPPPTPRKDSFSLKKRSSDLGSTLFMQRSEDLPSPQPPAPLRITRKPSVVAMTDAARLETPSRELPLPPRSQSPQLPPKDAPKDASSKQVAPELSARTRTPEPTTKPVIDLSISELPARAPTPAMDRPTPELPSFRPGTPDLWSKSEPVTDPLQTLKDLAKQTEALHARYTKLRSDRAALSMSIVSSLKEQKAGPEYCNMLLDQHLSLAAINSSMDICFAKLKSLDCRKEAAMTSILGPQEAKGRNKDKINKPAPIRSSSRLRSGRSTPDLVTDGVAGKQRSASKLRKDSTQADEPAIVERATRQDSVSSESDKGAAITDASSNELDKRATMIHSPPVSLPPHTGLAAEPEPYYPSDGGDSDVQPKKIRVKGAKAAKILGLMKEAGADIHRPGSPSITLPDDMEGRSKPSLSAARLIEVHIPTSRLSLYPPPSPAPAMSLPSPPSCAKQEAEDSAESPISAHSTAITLDTLNHARSPSRASDAHSRAGSNSAESSPEEPEIQTPLEEKAGGDEELPIGLKSARRGLLQTIQVFVDDEILDYYHNARSPLVSQ